jgi:tight adherence protein B
MWTAVRLAQATGAPVAELLERLVDDLRAADRVHAAVSAHSAGARASAWILMALPLAGVGLGAGVGADPGRVLLHTPLGAACLCAAVAIQLAGLAWSDRICAVEGT